MDPAETVRVLETGNKFIRLAIGLPPDLSGQVQVSLSDLQTILGGFIEIAAKHMTPAAHEATVRECYAMVRRQLGS
jgi:hypothetical protein